ncbi:MAG: P1 family peptidase [Verrucomicrobia bacterium]|nr:P1 family peptidase [Verrucomicrobiota bacterium]
MKTVLPRFIAVSLLIVLTPLSLEGKPRARDLGIPFAGTPGSHNAITDVQGVEVGHATLIAGQGKLKVGEGPVRTGVTAVLPRGRSDLRPAFGAWFSLNGNGEMTGTTWLEESGVLEGPVMVSNTHSVGIVRDAVIEWLVKKSGSQQSWALPIVAETFDGWLNDINGFHVKAAHAWQALEAATSGPVPEGNVGGGTGMICYEFKGGIGTSSRRLSEKGGGYVVGVLVQANFGLRSQLQIAGVPVGVEINDGLVWSKETGSIIVVLATDAPLLPHQLKRLARRIPLGMARTGSISGNGSGDIFIAFSTANVEATEAKEAVASLRMLRNSDMNGLFEATVQATEEAIINALVAAETMTGINDHEVLALPHDRVKAILEKYQRRAQDRRAPPP